MRRRQSLARTVSARGHGLHSGKPARVTLRPAEPGSGIVWVAGEAGRRVEIPTRVEHVVSTRAATTLARDGVRVGTVEHLLAALAGLGVDDLRVELEGEELPALDGSAAGFVALLREAGVVERGGAVEPLCVTRPLELRRGEARARVLPAPRLSLACVVDFAHPAIGRQDARLDPLSPAAFASEIAPARTFGFVRDVEALRAAGLARGASVENTLVFDDERVLNPDGARWPDEPARHKLLDLVGDLALLGRPLAARVEVERGGHGLHLALVEALLAR
jgi:UDP-3-O-[3-hydroxymyristoyl] N-acetylglucosamine deacetylase